MLNKDSRVGQGKPYFLLIFILLKKRLNQQKLESLSVETYETYFCDLSFSSIV